MKYGEVVPDGIVVAAGDSHANREIIESGIVLFDRLAPSDGEQKRREEREGELHGEPEEGAMWGIARGGAADPGEGYLYGLTQIH